MSINYRVDAKRNLVITQANGTIGALDICMHMNQVQHDPRFREGMNSIADATDARLDVSLNEIWEIARHAETLAHGAAPARWAVVAPGDAAFGSFRVFESIVRPFGIDAQVFRSQDDALAWLTQHAPSRHQNALPPHPKTAVGGVGSGAGTPPAED